METHNQTHKIGEAIKPLFVELIIMPITLYQWVISPWLGHHCRFQPTCSHYAKDALRAHGPLRGTWLAIRRLSKCHPWHAGGCDPVPLKSTSNENNGL